MALQVLVADDHPLVRGALAQVLARTFDGCEVAEAGGYEELRAKLAGAEVPDLILLDLHMPGMSGFIGLMMLRSEHPTVPVIVVSASEDAGTVQRAIDYGASGFVPKSAPVGELATAIRAVLDGAIWTPAESARDEADAAVADRVVSLTPQQLRVLAGMGAGKLNKQIAHDLGVSEQTVKDHVSTILRKLGATNRTQAILLASQLALKPPPSGAEVYPLMGPRPA
jgi:DNA-binding NarL/FixJ family response regulator